IKGIGAPEWAGAGDFDGDGKDEIAWYEHGLDGTVSVFGNTGHSMFVADASRWVRGWGTPDWAGVGDFDGDGKADIAWYEAWNGGSIVIGRSTGSTFVNAGKWISGLGKPDWAAVGDFDGDGKADIAWYEKWNKGGAISIMVSNGRSFSFPSTKEWMTGIGAPD